MTLPFGAPGYAWSCRACDATNPADAGCCTACGFKSRYTSAELAHAQGRMAPIGWSWIDCAAAVVTIGVMATFYWCAEGTWLMLLGPKLVLLGFLVVATIPFLLLQAILIALFRNRSKPETDSSA